MEVKKDARGRRGMGRRLGRGRMGRRGMVRIKTQPYNVFVFPF
jgi:hypothetical protein